MAFYGFFTKLSDFSGGTEDTSGTYHDANYVGQAVRVANNAASGVNWGTALTDCWIHFEWYPGAAWSDSLDTGRWFQIFNTNGEAVVNADLDTSVPNRTGIGISDSGSGWSYSSYITTTDALLQTIDIHVRINDVGTNYVDLYIDEVLTYSANTSWVDSTGVVQMVFTQEDTGDSAWYSEMMVADEDTRGLRLAELTGVGAGNGTAWTGDYTDVDERGDGLAMFTDTATDRESWTLSTYAGAASPTAIRGVFVQAFGKAGATGPSKIDPYLRYSSTNYDSALDVAPDPSTPVIAEWANNPNTASPWATTEFATLEVGIEAVT